MLFRGALFAIAIVLCVTQLAHSQTTSTPERPTNEPALRVESVSVGFGGKYKVGYWTPIRLEVATGEMAFTGRVALEIPDSEGGPCLWTDDSDAGKLDLQANEKATVVRYVKFGRLENRLTAVFEPSDIEPSEGVTQRIRLDDQISVPLVSTARFMLQLGDELPWSVVSQQRRQSGRETPEVIAVSQAALLPDSPLGFDAIDFVSVTTSDLKLLQGCSAAQRDALIGWVRTGGRLLLCVGKNGDAVLGKDGLLASLSPGNWVGVVQQNSIRSLEGFVQAEVRLDSVGGTRVRDFSLPLALVSDYRGRVVLGEAGSDGKARPVVISSPHGFGQVVYVGLDLDVFPFTGSGETAGWPSTPTLLEKLEDELMGHPPKISGEQLASSNLGYSDLAGQFQTALDRFPGVSLVPFSALVALIVGYGLLVSVADYFFLKRLVRRMHWTWLTFPLIAMVFCGLALYFLGSLRESTCKARQVEIVDIDAVSKQVRGHTWLHVYSPATTAYQISFARDDWKAMTDVHAAVCWHGMPGKGVGGMDRRALTSVFDEPYSQSQPGNASAVAGLPIQYASSRRLLDEWTAHAELSAVSDLKTDDGAYLRGSFVNPLNQDLDGVLLIYRNSAYRISSTIPAGQRQFVDPSDTPQNLNWLVTQRQTIETKDVSTPWEPNSEDISRLVEIFTLHEAAGAESYTGLSNQYYRTLDLTEHAAKGQAVLYGRVKNPISKPEIVSGGSEKPVEALESWTFVRILLPVVNERVNR